MFYCVVLVVEYSGGNYISTRLSGYWFMLIYVGFFVCGNV